MADSSVFDRLVETLSSSERSEMLGRLRNAGSVSEREVMEQDEYEPVDVQQTFQSWSLLRRLLVLLRSLLTGEDRLEVVTADLLTELGASIKSTHPGIIDLRRDMLLDPFYQDILSLRNSARFFGEPLERVWGRNRSQFLAFLLGLGAPDVQRRLIADTDPQLVAEDEPGISEHRLKKKLHNNSLQILELMPYIERDTLYANARFLDGLYQLALFPFEDILGVFTESEEGGVSAPLYAVRGPLSQLLAVLKLLGESPSSNVLEAVSLFNFDDELDRGASAVESELVTLVQNSAEHLRVIWDFIYRMPLHRLVRYARQEINFSVMPATGGEDWFALVKRFWRERIDRAFSYYHYRQQKRESLEEALEYTEGVTPVRIAGYPQAPGGYGKHAASLGLLRAVLEGPFDRLMHRPLKTLLIDGEFYKESNREEYTIAFNGLVKARETIDALVGRMSPSGDIGRACAAIGGDSSPREQRNQKLAQLAAQVDDTAASCISQTLIDLRVVSDVIYGILYGEVGGKYDTLANLGTIGGRTHQSLMQQLDTVMNRASTCRDGIGRLYDIENSIARRARNA